MAVKTIYTLKVVNIQTRLNIRSGPGTSFSIIGKRYNGNTFQADEVKTVGSITWYKEVGSTKWSAGNSSGGTPYLKVTATKVEGNEKPKPPDPEKPKPMPKPTQDTAVKGTSGRKIVDNDLNSDNNLGIPFQSNGVKQKSDVSVEQSEKLVLSSGNDVSWKMGNFINSTHGTSKYKNGKRVSGNVFPKPIKSGERTTGYDYSIKLTSDILEKYKEIRKTMNVPSAYNKNDINKYNHIYFNRFRIEYPDLYLQNTTATVFFTRPDLNLFSSGSNVNKQLKVDPRDYWILKQDIDIGRMLVADGGGSDTSYSMHNFNPMLSNLAQSLEIQDDSVDTLENGETFTGYKMQYSKHNNKSITAGQMSIKFRETANLSVTNMHQLWVDYQSNVYKGIYIPKRDNIWKKILDYACNIYYFLLDQDGKTILFWSKYYGCFPVNVPKSSFSFDYGSRISFPEVNVTYNYVYKSDLSPRTLVEFNNDGGNGNYTAMPIYPNNGDYNNHVTDTWVGVPFISTSRAKLGQNGIYSSFENSRTHINDSSDILTLNYRHR